MNYQQISLSRLSRSGKKLINDGAWHSFVNDEKQFYRVIGKIVQRIHLNENENHFRLMSSIDPLPSKLFREGFREEISIVQQDDHYVIYDILIHAFVGWEKVADVVRSKNIFLRLKNTLTLECEVRFDDFTNKGFNNALLYLKAFTLAVAKIQNSEHSTNHESNNFSTLFNATVQIVKESLHRIKDKTHSRKIF